MKFELSIVTILAQSLSVAASQCGLETIFTNDTAGSIVTFPDDNPVNSIQAIWPVLDMFPLSEADGIMFTLFYVGIDVFPGTCASSVQLGINATLISINNGQTLIQNPIVYYQLGDEITIFTNSTGDPIELVPGNTVLASITTDGPDLGLFFNPNFTPPNTSGAETSFAPLYGAAADLCAETAQWAVGSGRGSATFETGLAGFQTINFTNAVTFANDAESFEPLNGLLLGLTTDSSVVVEVNAASTGLTGGGSIEFGFLDKC